MTISAFFAVFGIITICQVDKTTMPLHSDIPNSLESLIVLSAVDVHVKDIRYCDEVLTRSARNFASAQDPVWIERYNETVLLLDE